LNRVLFRDRTDAGKRLALALRDYKDRDVVVLAIPRGGIVVAEVVARELQAPLDIVVTRKISPPGEPEYALGAVTQDGEVIMDRQAAESLGVGKDYLDSEIGRKRKEVTERTKRLRGDRPFPSLEGKVVIVVDDGIATGSSVGAAVLFLKKMKPREIVVGVPVSPKDAVETLSDAGNRVVCLETPGPFFSIGEFYEDFEQVEDAEVKRILDERTSSERSPQSDLK
jgi:putative phosphoribosyl transferase